MSCQDSKSTPGLKKPVDVKMIAAIHTKSGPPLRLGRKGTGVSGDGVGHAGKLLPWRDYLSTMPMPISVPEIVERASCDAPTS